MDQLLSCGDESHLYLLDAAGAFSAAVTSPRVGAVVGLHELRRAVRVLERVSEEMTRRLSAAHTADAPALVLALCGWGSWVSAFRAGPLAWAEDLVQDLVRDGARAGITVLVAGERELVTARFFAAVPNRIFLPAGSTDEARLAWPRLPAIDAACRPGGGFWARVRRHPLRPVTWDSSSGPAPCHPAASAVPPRDPAFPGRAPSRAGHGR